MKSINIIKRFTFTIACASVFIFPAFAALNTNTGVSAQPVGLFSHKDKDQVTGTVTAKTAATLTVDDKILTVTDNTSFMKNGSSVKSDDVQVGDRVKVTTSKDASGTLTALTVTDEGSANGNSHSDMNSTPGDSYPSNNPHS